MYCSQSDNLMLDALKLGFPKTTCTAAQFALPCIVFFFLPGQVLAKIAGFNLIYNQIGKQFRHRLGRGFVSYAAAVNKALENEAS